MVEGTKSRLVLFKDSPENDPTYGLIFENGWVLCLCCGSWVESEDAIVLQDLGEQFPLIHAAVSEAATGKKTIRIPLENGSCIVAENDKWSDVEPEELGVFIEKDGTTLQEIALIKEAKADKESIDLTAWVDPECEDNTCECRICVREDTGNE